MLRSSSRTSTNTGVAPAWTITFAVAGHVIGVVITSSPAPTPSATRERWSAAVPEASASTYSASTYSAKRRSSSAAAGPLVSQPERSVSATAAISSSPIAGGWKPSFVLRRVSDESFDIDSLESNHRLGLGSALQCVLAAAADGEDCPGAVGPTPELAEVVALTPVDADPSDAWQRECLLDAGDLLQLAPRGDDK